MRIILGVETCNGCKFFIENDCKAPSYPCYMNRPIEITDTEWAIIERGWHREVYELGTYEFPFAQYIKDLIKLRGE